jgi:hypothetical protein
MLFLNLSAGQVTMAQPMRAVLRQTTCGWWPALPELVA